MPVELRKRKAPAEPAYSPPAKKKSNPIKNAVSKAKAALTGKKGAAANGPSSTSNPAVGSSITIADFGGEFETHDGEKTSLKKLVDASKAGVVLFTYPKASTPGCTTQACMFRDDYTSLTSTGLSIYGLSRDSPKANTTFKNRQNLPYTLLSDPSANLIGAIGMKKPGGTIRGVFVVDKSGKVLVAEAGGPGNTVAAVRKYLDEGTAEENPDAEMADAPAESEKAEDTALVPSAPSTSVDETAPEPEAAAPAADPEPSKVSAPAESAAPAVDSATAAPAAVVAPPATTAVEETAPEPEAPVPAKEAAPVEAPKEVPAVNGDADKKAEDTARAKVAADVADTAAKLDPATPNPA